MDAADDSRPEAGSSSLFSENSVENREIGFELYALSCVALSFGMGYFIVERLQLPVGSVGRAAPIFCLFAVVNLLAAAIAGQGLRWIPTKGLVFEIALFITLSVTSAAVANSLDVVLWLGFGNALKMSMVPHLFFFLAIIFGILGMFRLSRLLHVRIGMRTLSIYLIIIAVFAVFPLWISPQMIAPGVLEKNNARDVMFHVIYAALNGLVAALAIQNGIAATGRLKGGARLVSIGAALLAFGCILYAQAGSRLSALEVAASPIHVVLAFAYSCIGLGVLRFGARMVEMFSPDFGKLPPSQPLIDIFGVSIGMKVYEGLVWRIKSSEADLTQVRGENRARAEVIEALEIEVQRRKRVEDELRDAKDKAETANLAKSRFLAMMSHELRTPLTMVHGYGAMLSDPRLQQYSPLTFEEVGTRICQSSRHLQSVIEGILDFSSIELGRILLKKSPLDIQELVSFMRSFGESQVLTKNVTFRCVVPEIFSGVSLDGFSNVSSELAEKRAAEKPVMKTDLKILRQILVNLVGNASKFTSKGEVVLEIQSADEGMSFHVCDTGPGIPEAELEKVFEPFYQVSQGNTRRFGGVGLGLTIVKRLAEVLGGTLTLQSRLNEGTRITLFLPTVSIFECSQIS
ncbi:MAG: ATP-binding protein [Candidatus Ozemobacteraceae bacterium]